MTTYTTRIKRGFFGWAFLALFWAFQALMVATAMVNMEVASIMFEDTGDEAQNAANAIVGGAATGLAAIVGWFVWALGTLVLGVLVLASRGKRITVAQ